MAKLNNMTPTAKWVLGFIAKFHNLTPQEIVGKSRERRLNEARTNTALVLRMQGLSYPAIGQIMNRDSTSIIYYARRYQRRKPTAQEQRESMRHFRSRLEWSAQAGLTTGDVVHLFNRCPDYVGRAQRLFEVRLVNGQAQSRGPRARAERLLRALRTHGNGTRFLRTFQSWASSRRLLRAIQHQSGHPQARRGTE